jgi:hypothetical protein
MGRCVADCFFIDSTDPNYQKISLSIEYCHSRKLLSGIQTHINGPPIKTFGGDRHLSFKALYYQNL